MVVGIGTAVEGLNVLGVEGDGGRGVLDDLVPVAERIVAGSPVRVVDRVGFAENGLGVEPDGLLEVLSPVGLVAGLLQLLCVLLALELGKGLDGGLVYLGQLVGGFDRGRLGRGSGSLGLLCGCGRFLGFGVPLGLLPFPSLLLTKFGRGVLSGRSRISKGHSDSAATSSCSESAAAHALTWLAPLRT